MLVRRLRPALARMRAFALAGAPAAVLALAASLPACDLQQRGVGGGDAGNAVDAGAAGDSSDPRCTLQKLRAPGGLADSASPSTWHATVLGGPQGPRVLTREVWLDPLVPSADSTEPSAAADPTLHPVPTTRSGADWSLAWTGERYVGYAGRELFNLDASLAAPHAIERSRATPCDLALVETGDDGAVAVYRDSPDEHCAPGTGTLTFRRFLRSGAPAGPAARLLRADEREPARRIRGARVDAGRVVVSLEGAGGSGRYAVLSFEGQELLTGDGDNVACPRAGCVRLLGREDASSPSQAEPSRDGGGLLRVELPGRARGFTLPVDVDRVLAVAAQGDRVALYYDAPRYADQQRRRRVAVVDVVQRRVELIVDAETRHEAQWIDWELTDYLPVYRLAARDEGFVITSDVLAMDQLVPGRPVYLLRCR